MNSPSLEPRCYQCFRPRNYCYCESIPEIDNQTAVLILQDRKEHFHPFNSARMVSAALKKSRLIAARPTELSSMGLSFEPNAGLLFPATDARLLADLPKHQHPDQLVVIDGTWHQAKRLVRDIPQLQKLPKFKIHPEQPGQYRIRREPDAISLSTVEAVVEALHHLEPDPSGLSELLGVFLQMVQAQLDCPKLSDSWRENLRRNGTPFNIPVSIIRNLDNVVVAYGESVGGERTQDKKKSSEPRRPVYWIAQRMGTGEQFVAAIRDPRSGITDESLEHLQLERGDFVNALTVDQFRSAWSRFLRPSDKLACYNCSTNRLLRTIGASFSEPLILKSVDLKREQRNGSLDNLLNSLDIDKWDVELKGRAGVRLAKAIALLRYLNQVGVANQLGDTCRVSP